MGKEQTFVHAAGPGRIGRRLHGSCYAQASGPIQPHISCARILRPVPSIQPSIHLPFTVHSGPETIHSAEAGSLEPYFSWRLRHLRAGGIPLIIILEGLKQHLLVPRTGLSRILPRPRVVRTPPPGDRTGIRPRWARHGPHNSPPPDRTGLRPLPGVLSRPSVRPPVRPSVPSVRPASVRPVRACVRPSVRGHRSIRPVRPACPCGRPSGTALSGPSVPSVPVRPRPACASACPCLCRCLRLSVFEPSAHPCCNPGPSPMRCPSRLCAIRCQSSAPLSVSLYQTKKCEVFIFRHWLIPQCRKIKKTSLLLLWSVLSGACGDDGHAAAQMPTCAYVTDTTADARAAELHESRDRLMARHCRGASLAHWTCAVVIQELPRQQCRAHAWGSPCHLQVHEVRPFKEERPPSQPSLLPYRPARKLQALLQTASKGRHQLLLRGILL